MTASLGSQNNKRGASHRSKKDFKLEIAVIRGTCGIEFKMFFSGFCSAEFAGVTNG
jgi:hypothetical protein